MVRPHRQAESDPNSSQDHPSPYGDIVEAVTTAKSKREIIASPMDKVTRSVMKGVALIPRFGHTFETAAYSRIDLRLRRLREHGMITEVAQDTLLNFFGHPNGHSIAREDYEKSLRTMHDHIETAVLKEREKAPESDEGPHKQTMSEIAFAVGRYSMHMAMKYEIGSPTVMAKGAGFHTLIEQMRPEAQTTIQACVGYALPSVLYREPKI